MKFFVKWLVLPAAILGLLTAVAITCASNVYAGQAHHEFPGQTTDGSVDSLGRQRDDADVETGGDGAVLKDAEEIPAEEEPEKIGGFFGLSPLEIALVPFSLLLLVGSVRLWLRSVKTQREVREALRKGDTG